MLILRDSLGGSFATWKCHIRRLVWAVARSRGLYLTI